MIGHVVFVLMVKNVIKNEKFYFEPNQKFWGQI